MQSLFFSFFLFLILWTNDEEIENIEKNNKSENSIKVAGEGVADTDEDSPW